MKLRVQVRTTTVLFAVCAASFALRAQWTKDPAAWVDPLIGTANSGNVFPGAVVPFGMLSWSPEEASGNAHRDFPPGGYTYAGRDVRGFALTHLSGAGCDGGGDIPFMPLTHSIAESPALNVLDPAYLSDLSHEQEQAEAGSYRVRLGNGVEVELTATERTGSGRFRFPDGKPAVMLIRSADSQVDSSAASVVLDAEHRTVSGSVTSGDFCGHGRGTDAYYTLYFVAHFDRPFQEFGTWQDAIVTPSSTSANGGTSLGDAQKTARPSPGKGSGAYVTFAGGADVGVRVGISYVSSANAEANLAAENPEGTPLLAVRRRAHDAWNSALGSISIQDGTQDQRRVFYTALYHSLLHMNLASDVNGEYRGMDLHTHTVTLPQRAQYANFSGWDVYRSQVQLVSWLFPQIAGDMAQSLLNQADQWGCWDRWTHNSGPTNVMNVDPSAAAIASMEAFGAEGFDVHAAYLSLLEAANQPHEGHRCSRPRLANWLSQHYLTGTPGKHDTSVADTLEFATADYSLSQLAAQQGDVTHAQALLARAQYWRNLFNPHATPGKGYLQAKSPDGRWKIFDPASTDGFVEGTGAQYLWMVPFNVRGLFDALGGNDAASRRLDAFFRAPNGNWALTTGGLHPGLDNEPVLETPWLYDFSGQPWKTQQTVRAILDTLWKPTPDGIPGNDDLGEMSSWYVFAALGLYPEIPGRAELLLATPLFPAAIVHRKQGDVRIFAPRRSASSIYVESLRVDGQPSERPWLPADFVLHGGELRFTLGDRPATAWGSAPAAAPPSFDLR